MVKMPKQSYDNDVIESFMGRLHPQVQEVVKTSMILTLGKMIEVVAKEKHELEELEEMHCAVEKNSW